MYKRGLAVIVAILILVMQMGILTVYAQSEVKVSVEPMGSQMIDGKPSPMEFWLHYSFDITTNRQIAEIRLEERAEGESDAYFYQGEFKSSMEGKKRSTLEGYKDITYTVTYRFKDKDQWEAPVTETVTVVTANADLAVYYRAEHGDKVYKGDKVRFIAEVESLGNVRVRDIAVIDSVHGELGRINNLAPGNSAVVEKEITLDKSSNSFIELQFVDPITGKEIKQGFSSSSLRVDVLDEVSVASLEMTGEADREYIPGQSSVEFTITIENSGNSTLKDIECLDWNGEVIHTQERLMPGQQAVVRHKAQVEPEKTYRFTANATTENSNQRIQADYSAMLKKLDPRASVEHRITPEDLEYGDTATIDFVVSNTGNVALEDIKIKDQQLGEIGGINRLEAGAEEVLSKEFVIEEDLESTTVLTAVEAATGTKYQLETTLTVTVQEKEIPTGLSLILKADTEQVGRGGNIAFTCIVENTGEVALHNLDIFLMERNIPVENILVLEPGEQRSIEVMPLTLEETETFFLKAVAEDAEGNQVEFTSDPLTAEVDGQGDGKRSILKVIIIISVLLVVLIAGTIFYIIKGPVKFKGIKSKSSSK